VKAADCFYKWWPDHGAGRLIEALEDEADRLTCYASTMKEHRPNYSAMLMRDAAKALAFYEQNAAPQMPAESGALNQSAAAAPIRPCTCHPDDNPPVPCQQKYALEECRKAARLAR
jgi:hypothetical protein